MDTETDSLGTKSCFGVLKMIVDELEDYHANRTTN